MAILVRPLGLPLLFDADRPPGAADDRDTLGARPWSRWFHDGREWVCRDDTPGAALWVELAASADVQPVSGVLTALSGLDAAPGLVEQTGAAAFTKRALGVAGDSSVPTRGDADARYAGLGHGHAAATTGAPGFMSAVDKTKLDGIAAGAQPGTVTSIALSAPGVFTVSGSPVTGAGTLTISLATQAAHTLWAGPVGGAAAAPTFRALAEEDIAHLQGIAIGGVFVVERNAAYNIVAADHRALLLARSGAPTWTLPSAASLPAGWCVAVKARGTTLTVECNGADDLDGAASLAVADGESRWIARSSSAGFETL
jgi:hypothetical protein